MMKAIFFVMLFVITIQHTSCGQQGNKQQTRTNKSVGGGCDGCEIMYTNMPARINEIDTSYGWSREGEKMKVEGTVYLKDGKTPAANIIVYYWQTNTAGLYAPSETDKTRHGAIRGWIKTGADGKYILYTIKPVSYPKSSIPAHIHFLIKEPSLNEYYTDDLNFEDDPFLTDEERKKLSLRCGPGIVKLNINSEGILYCKRDFILGLNIPDYPDN